MRSLSRSGFRGPGGGGGSAAGDVAKVAVGQLEGLIRVDLADDGQAGVGRDVESFEEGLDIIAAGGFDIFHDANGEPAIRVGGWVEGLGHESRDLAVGAIGVILAVLVLDDIFLDAELGVVERREQVPHAVGLHGQGELQVGDGQVDVVIGSIGGSGAIDACAQALEGLEKIARIMLRPLEHEVLEEVREAALAAFLVFGTDVVPEINGDDGKWSLAPDDDVEAVGERGLGEVDAGEVSQACSVWVPKSSHG